MSLDKFEERLESNNELNVGATKHPEDLNLWAALKDNPYDFPTWEAIIRSVESRYIRDPKEPLFQAYLKDVMENFFSLYPLCFGYWLRWEDLHSKAHGYEESIEVLSC